MRAISAKAALYWFTVILLVSMFTEAVSRIVTIGLCIASGWWLVRKLTTLCFGRSQRFTVASEKAKEVAPSYTSFT